MPGSEKETSVPAPGGVPWQPKRVLAIGAHPDDVEYFAGGTLLRLVEGGAALALVVCSDGSRGGRDLTDPGAVRRAEQAEAAKRIGATALHWLGHVDGELAPGDPLRRELVLAIRRERPELVMAHDPRTLWTVVGAVTQPGHSDHRAAGQAALDAIYPRAPSPSFYWEQLAGAGESEIPGFEATSQAERLSPWYPREVWLFDTAAPELRVEVGAVFERKLELLAAHASQESVAGGLADAARALGAHWGSPAQPAEAFVRLRLY
jgi:LmbE family N-acetylglucosaminyl deacetylase